MVSPLEAKLIHVEAGRRSRARALFQQALKIDPNNADALAGGAYT